MKQQIYTSDLKDLILQNTYPLNYCSEEGITEREILIRQPFGESLLREIFFEDVFISYGNMQLQRTTLLHTEIDFETVTLHFSLDGGSLSRFAGQQTPFTSFDSNVHNIIYTPYYQGQLELEQHSNISMLEINMSPAFFRRIAPAGFYLFNDFHAAIHHKRPAVLRKQNLPITPQMLWTIKQLMGCNRKGLLKRLFLEARIIDLFMMQVEQFELYGDTAVTTTLSKKDLPKIHYARHLLLEHLQQPLSIMELARSAGINDFKLKKGFKEVFGTTVFGFVHETRMQHAKEKLLDGEMNISEVADYTGYKNRTHFTTAFKKHFGFLPSELRK
ncbi:helix-turn-helix transcriptional regulator [Chitinophaga nivalis]|uniref:AraC family transcriptional regulator n=1 Tax=Chitinophaga nivalis TaxID=2991709 RepID=A0ABT3IID1_9BACT|nr:AraC family transcriptional regulator [Chitinophaga nivalis]MCW3466628.1 AraC family transcriptional regulator [Chitinophaga nivalis]MCW3483681.1 AraC family transcriptional regulator [Chitinophaga nivalis]